ncbi:MAG TPA: ECF-type sigma factor [Pirellulaceae bacterium]
MGNKAQSLNQTESKSAKSRKHAQLPSVVYADLKQIAERFMRGEGAGHSLQPTALVHEAFLRVAGHQSMAGLSATHVRALFAQTMRRILVDHARRKKASKRGGKRVRVELDERLIRGASDEDLLDLDAILGKLEAIDPAQAELVELRIFGGMTVAEAADEMGVSKRTAEREWTAAKAWLRRELQAADSE